MSNTGLVGSSLSSPSAPGQSEDEVAESQASSLLPLPRAEERESDALKTKDVNDASTAEYGPNQRSEAFKRGLDVGKDVGRENFAGEKKTVPESKYHPDYKDSEGSQQQQAKDTGRGAPPSINPSSREPNPGDYYGSTGGY